MRDYTFSKQFRRDFKLMERRHRDMDAISEIMSFLISGEPLPARCQEHGLSGNLKVYTECHVEGDLLMTYILTEDTVTFHRLGTHADLF
ncbi:addiction module toxin, RelE/StbE family [Spirochaetia bacterium]|nr:addiction module toxin, RelE/StbE family [Spirochaetia bacterium]